MGYLLGSGGEVGRALVRAVHTALQIHCMSGVAMPSMKRSRAVVVGTPLEALEDEEHHEGSGIGSWDISWVAGARSAGRWCGRCTLLSRFTVCRASRCLR